MTGVARTIFEFGGFTLDLTRGCLRTGDREIELRPKSFQVLCYLVENAGRLLPKDELLGAVWPHVTVTEEALTHCISDVRRALDDREQCAIRTVPRRGYLFALPVNSAGNRPGSLRGATGGLEWRAPEPGVLPLPDKPSVAVLPFTSMGGHAEQDCFADGITEEVTTSLSRIRWLFVIARNSTLVYKHRLADAKQVSRDLGVRYILHGTVRRAGRRLRVTAQLADAILGCENWAERYDRTLGDIFALQDEIARSVAGVIEPHLLAAEGTRARTCAPGQLGAWELVIRALGVFWRLTRDDTVEAIADLRKAIRMYPEYAPAHSLLAYCLVFAVHIGWIDPQEALALGKQHALRGAALDESDAWAHIAMGYLAMMERRTEDSIAACRRALNLNPNSATGHLHLGIVMAHAGLDREAIASCDSAIRLSPRDPQLAVARASIGVAHYLAGRFTSAIEAASVALQLRPGTHGFQRLLCASLAQSGRLAEARHVLAELRREQPQLSIDWIRQNVPYQTPALMERFLDGMRKVGLRDAAWNTRR